MFRTTLLAFLLLAAPSVIFAQTGRAAPDTVLARAQQLVADGHGDAGRALVAQRLQETTPGSSEYVEALFWRAALAATAAEAETDYRRIIVEHPASPRVEDALTRLAQLEMARGRPEEALRHLDRLAREYPASPSRARAHYWMARVLLDDNQLPRGCARLAEARASAPDEDVELRNQIDYHWQRCIGVDTTRAAAAPARAAPARAAAQEREAPAQQRPAAPAQQRPAAPAQQRPAAPAPTAGSAWTVQVAAVATRAAAVEVQERIRARGYDARVVQVGNLWRVRVGRYATRADAAAMSGRLTAQRIDNFVTEAEPR